MNDFFIADTHFHHTNILTWSDRPFKSVEEMNETLIQNWNKIIRKKSKDKVYVLGDFSFGNSYQVSKIIRKLNGTKILIMGNHDRKRTRTWWLNVGFDRVIEFPVIYKNEYVLSHEPINIGLKNIHGHLHNKQIYMKSHFSVCAEQIDYAPIRFDILLKKWVKIDKERRDRN